MAIIMAKKKPNTPEPPKKQSVQSVAKVVTKPIPPKVTTKSKVSPQPKVDTELTTLINELGTTTAYYDDFVKQVGILKKKKDLLEAQICELVEDENPESTFTLEGSYSITSIGQRGNESELVNKAKAIVMLEKIKAGLFKDLAKLSITDLKAYLTPEQYNLVVQVKRTGKRSIKTVKKTAFPEKQS